MKLNITNITKKLTGDLDETVDGVFELWSDAGFPAGVKGLIFAAIEKFKRIQKSEKLPVDVQLPEWMTKGDSHSQTEDVWIGLECAQWNLD